MPRFFLPPEQLTGRFTVLTGELAAHAKVLRLKPGDSVTLCDGRGTDFAGAVSDVSPGQISQAAQSLRLHTRYFLTEQRKACPERTSQYD